MRKIMPKILSFILCCLLSLNSVYIAKADTLSPWIELARMDNVAVNKTFTVVFTKNIVEENIDAIVIEQNNKFVAVNISYDSDKAYVTPVKPFAEGEYKFKILLGNGKKYFMKFTTSNIEYDYTKNSRDKVIKVYPRKDSGFSYPYYLSIPNNLVTSKDINIIVEPNNDGRVGDVEKQDTFVKDRILNEGSLAASVNKQINSIILMPVFPRGVTSDGYENWKLYTHELDRDTILGYDNEKIRIDDQLINMINDAKNVINKENITFVKDKVLMIGFSASARFVNRFALLHPELVQAVATGGINSNPIIPLEELEGQKLIYPVGLGDAKEILGRDINLDAYKKVKQYIYMGELDTNDDVSGHDGYDDAERQLIYNLIGRNQLPDRWNKSQKIFSNLPYPIQFVTYKGIGHTINRDTISDVTKFFEQNAGNEFLKIQPHNAY
ncbi:Ig-like domain-containing protein [Clostridium bowmanii]|uniref:Ig-like domain-containing protein n=1 Tax=Clostridium bowmanii TaxID=132925 RepID=UPI001C0DB97F|nr:Ig-like domain-containing protein [Clostridium bowmanii]MBU3190286.1 Ig-like domain-containing protein [Clostridium bowmanii]MCA1072502.1 Ig-like domain-containing protein [Clostridium bowmanii]